jgi:hypothetical protein
VPHISLVFREMWDTAAAHLRVFPLNKRRSSRLVVSLCSLAGKTLIAEVREPTCAAVVAAGPSNVAEAQEPSNVSSASGGPRRSTSG